MNYLYCSSRSPCSHRAPTTRTVHVTINVQRYLSLLESYDDGDIVSLPSTHQDHCLLLLLLLPLFFLSLSLFLSPLLATGLKDSSSTASELGEIVLSLFIDLFVPVSLDVSKEISTAVRICCRTSLRLLLV